MRRVVFFLLLCSVAIAGPDIVSMNSGEVSPYMLRRIDFEKYDSSLETLQNMLIRAEGPVERRPGTKYIATAKEATQDVRLLKFEQSKTDAYIIEAGDLYFRFYRNGGQILDANSDPYEITTSFDEADLRYIQFVQNANVMYLVDGNDPPQKLTREDHTDWTIEDVNFDTGPFLDENGTTTTVEPNALTGTIRLIASDNIFDGNHVGALWRIGYKRTDIPLEGTLSGDGSSSAIEVDGTFYYNIQGKWEGDVLLEKSYDDGATYQTVYPRYNDSSEINEDFDDSEPDEDVLYRVTMENYVSGSAKYYLRPTENMSYGIVRITAYVDPNEVTALVLSTLADANTATDRWSEGAWSDYRGWPQTIEFYEQRLLFGGSRSYPQTIWATKTASGKTKDYENMTAGVDDDDALIYILPGQNPIQWMCAQSQLMIGTLKGVGKWGSNDESKAITPTEPTNFRMQALYGAEFVQAEGVGDSVLYVERGGHRVREIAYSLETDKYIAPDLTKLASHITGDGIMDIAYQSRPTPILWCALENGPLATMTYERMENVVGWSWHTPWSGTVFGGGPQGTLISEITSSQTGMFVTNLQNNSDWLAVRLEEDGDIYTDWGANGAVEDIDHYDSLVLNCYVSPYTGKFYISNRSSAYDIGYYTASTGSPTGTISVGDTVIGSVNGHTYLVDDIITDADNLTGGGDSINGIIVVSIVSGSAYPANSETLVKDGSNSVQVVSGDSDYAVIRYNADGSIDTDWGHDGYKGITRSFAVNCIVEDSSGNTYIGSASQSGVGNAVIISLDSDGLYRYAYCFEPSNPNKGQHSIRVDDMVLSQDESILYCACNAGCLAAVCNTTTQTGYNMMVLNASDGTYNTDWGNNGRFTDANYFSYSTGDNYELHRKPLTDELFVIAEPFLTGGHYWSVLKLNEDGSVDTDWGTNGRAGYDVEPPGAYSTTYKHNACIDEYGDLWLLAYDYTGGVEDDTNAFVICYDGETGAENQKWNVDGSTSDNETCIMVYGDYVYLGGKVRTIDTISSCVHRYEYDGTHDTGYAPAAMASGQDYGHTVNQITRIDDLEYVYAESYNVSTGGVEGGVISVETIPGSDEDEVWIVARRSVGGIVYKYIEQFQPRDYGSDINDAWYVDCGISFDGGDAVTITNITQASPAVVTVSEWPTDGAGTDLADDDHVKITGVYGMTEINNAIYTIDDADSTALTFSLDNSIGGTDINSVGYTAYVSGGSAQKFQRSFTGGDHLATEDVTIYADGQYAGTGTFGSDGSLNINTWVNRAVIGIPYTSVVKTLPIIVPTPTGASVGKVARIDGIVLDFYKSLGVEYGQASDNVSPVAFYDNSQSRPYPFYTGLKAMPFQHGFTRDNIVYLTTDKPLPFCLRMIKANIVITER